MLLTICESICLVNGSYGSTTTSYCKGDYCAMESIVVVKIVNKDKTYKADNGKEYVNTNYYLRLSNGTMVAIRPSFAKGYTILDSICETRINGK